MWGGAGEAQAAHTWSSQGVPSLTSPIPGGAESQNPPGLSVPRAEVAGAWDVCGVMNVNYSITTTWAISKVKQETRSSKASSSLLTGFQKT